MRNEWHTGELGNAKKNLADLANAIIADTQELALDHPNEVAALKEKGSLLADAIGEIERICLMERNAERE